MQILFSPVTVTSDEWAEICATVSSLRGEAFAFDEPRMSSEAAPTAAVAPAIAAAPPPPVAEAAPVAPPPPAAVVAEAAPVAPPPPAAEAAPAAPLASEALMQAAVAANVSGVKIDKHGIPWDARIHSDPPTITAKKEWRKKRSVADDLVASVTAELLQVMAAPAPAAAAAPVAEAAPAAPVAAVAPPPPVAEAAPPPPVAIATEAAPVAAVAPPPPAIAVEGNAAIASPETPVVAAPTPAPSAPAPTPPVADTGTGAAVASGASNPFAEFMKGFVARKAAGQITDEQVAETAAALGLTGIKDLNLRHDLIPSFEALLG